MRSGRLAVAPPLKGAVTKSTHEAYAAEAPIALRHTAAAATRVPQPALSGQHFRPSRVGGRTWRRIVGSGRRQSTGARDVAQARGPEGGQGCDDVSRARVPKHVPGPGPWMRVPGQRQAP